MTQASSRNRDIIKNENSLNNNHKISLKRKSPNGIKLTKENSKLIKIEESSSNKIKLKKETKISPTDCKIYPPEDYKSIKKVKPLKSLEDVKIDWTALNEQNSQIKWESLKHNGVLFPPPYSPHNIPVFYKGKKIALTPEQEEAATWFAAIIETDHAKNPIFRKNFFKDWKKLLGRSSEIKNLDEVDFKPIFDHLQAEKERKKEEKKAMTKEEKDRLKAQKELEIETYGYALIDQTRERISNYYVEIPGLFRGRGKHPKAGAIKKRLQPEDIVINVGRNERIPKCPLEGHKWGGIMHNNTVTYIARWKDPILDNLKFIYMHNSSLFKCRSDLKKYEIAREQKPKIKRIREQYMKGLKDDDVQVRQRSVVVWIIDHLSIRAGNEKDTSKTADTVGVCSFRREHIKFLPDFKIEMDFLGKDSIRYLNVVKIDERVYKTFKKLCKDKKPTDPIFDKINTTLINKYLNSLSPKLTAKVFRTFNASITLQTELMKEGIKKGDSEARKKYFYDNANRQVAILCNHKKTVSKTFGDSLEKIKERAKKLKEKLQKYRKDLKESKNKVAEKEKEKERIRKRKTTLINRITRIKTQLDKIKLQVKLKASTKEIALGTSKINYMDPRITVAWCKRYDMPINKIFQKALLEKFPWANSVGPDFVW